MNPFLVLYKLQNSQNLSVQAVGAEAPEIALQAVGEALVEQGQQEAMLLGVFAKEDLQGMLQLMNDLEDQMKGLAG